MINISNHALKEKIRIKRFFAEKICENIGK